MNRRSNRRPESKNQRPPGAFAQRKDKSWPVITLILGCFLAISLPAVAAQTRPSDEPIRALQSFNVQSLRLAIEDLAATYPWQYTNAGAYLERLEGLESRRRAILAANPQTANSTETTASLVADLFQLKRRALLENPLLQFEKLLLVRHDAAKLKLPRNDACYSSIPQDGYACEIATLSLAAPEDQLKTLFRPEAGRYIADLDLHFNAKRLLFTMPGTNRWQVHEINVDGSGLRQVTPTHEDVDCFDPCYLPDEKIIFCSTANFQSVPCYNGTRRVGGLYVMDPDGSNIRQLTFDQDDDSYPSVMHNGRVMFTRWEYSGTPHFFMRLVFQMNPDGSGQEELYGSGSWWPNAIYGARSIPGHSTMFAGIVSGHHGDRRMGELVLFNPAIGRQEAKGVVQRIPGRGKPVEPIIKDTLVNDSWPKFMTPWPLGSNYFLVSCKPNRKADWGIYVADAFDNLLLLRQEKGFALLEPLPLEPRPAPPALPDKVDLTRNDGLVYIVDIYQGGGLKGIPRGAVKNLRVVSPHYGYFGNAGWLNVAIDGTWDVQRILGTVSVHPDGSAYFRVPANTPISLQPLDADGKALQLMRSWFTAMPGETKSCTGCHEPANRISPNIRTIAASRKPEEVKPWHGPARGFSFERDVQPVLDAHCVRCHHGQPGRPDLRGTGKVPGYAGTIAPIPQVITNGQLAAGVSMDDLGVETSPLCERHQQRIKFTPAYEALHPYVRRGGSESEAHMLVPCEFDANTSELVQMLRQGHHGVRLDPEAWDRLFTWIDLNVPCHGTWHEVYPIPFKAHERRLHYLKMWAGVEEDYEAIPPLPLYVARESRDDATPPSEPRARPPAISGFPFDAAAARARQAKAAAQQNVPVERQILIGEGVALHLVFIPAGAFLMGCDQGADDDLPPHPETVSHPFWIGRFEISNREYSLFDPQHDSGYINQLGTAVESRGYPANEPDQPVVRVSWERANGFCEWLSKQTGLKFSLPTEPQWEYACRAGTASPLWYGSGEQVFDTYGNMADSTLSQMARRVPGKFLYSDHPDWVLRDNQSNDKALVTAKVGGYAPNPWGLCDMHGNAAEWTASDYGAHQRTAAAAQGFFNNCKTVRGGSWYDRPQRCASGFRVGYPSWQRVYNVGFRVICEK